MFAAKAAVKEMRSDGATGELDGNVISGTAPRFAVLSVGPSDELFELIKLIVHMPAQVSGRVDTQLSEHGLELGAQVCYARVARDLSTCAANDET